jgi:alpha,alpha-trehalose-phosphate synthase [UDP-forming]/trehalose-phosphatase
LNPADRWLILARHTPLAVLVDLDGTIIPFADRPDQARVPEELAQLLQSIAASPGVQVAIVSGRPREALERFFPSAPAVWLIAEHGGWRRADGAWSEAAPGEPRDLEALAADFDRIAASFPGTHLERKTWSVAFHYRLVPARERGAFLVEVSAAIERWLADHPGFERLEGAKIVEVRAARIRKSLAIPWLRERAGAGARLIALGDDVTDEDMFRALGPQDEAVLVSAARGRVTDAHWTLPGPDEAVRFLKWIGAARGPALTPPLDPAPRPIPARRAPTRTGGTGGRLLAISNRLPDLRDPTHPEEPRRKNVGGLVSALEPVLKRRDGLWLGWSGRTDAAAPSASPGIDESASPRLAWIDLTSELHRLYYSGFCNQSLWPLFHAFPSRVRFADLEWEAYVQVNDLFADAAQALVDPNTPIWVHDYHLLLLAAALRRRGHRGPIGLFLHVPFPGADLFRMVPWADRLIEDLLAFDLLGFHTPNDVSNLLQTVGYLSPAKVGDDAVQHRGRRVRVRVFPIGIIPESFQEPPETDATDEASALIRSIGTARLIVGVDRLDYTKGIPQRLEAFARMLGTFPEWRGRVSLVQISVPSRADVPEYREQRQLIESTVKRINADFGTPGWTPVRYLYRSYGRPQLVQFYRAGKVALVTPLRDGMNLVAKEYVAAQDPADPGVLLLSKFAGAAVELTEALLTNPFHIDGMARDLDRALRMDLEERRQRHAILRRAVERTTALTWAEEFVTALEKCRGA